MECFKPLRNYLRQYNVVSFLHAIWSLTNHFEFGRVLPEYLRDINPYGFRDVWGMGFYLWELDTLSREVILHCDPTGGKVLKDWNGFRTAVQKLKQAEQEAVEVTTDNVMAELTRIAHRQFHWQQGVSHNDIARTRKIYRTSGMNDVMDDVYGMTAEQVVLAGFAITSTYLESFAINGEYPGNVAKQLGFNPSPLYDNLTADLATIRQAAHDMRQLNGNWPYAFNPLWLHPLIRIEDGKRVICPMPGLLARRVTDGLYFDIAGHDVNILSAKLGPSFQGFVGEVLDRANDGNFTVIGEEVYGTKKKPEDTVDWTVVDETATLFVEVKLLKMGKALKETLAPDAGATVQLQKLAKAIGQVYATVADALAGKYPTWKPNGKPIYPMIVTLDNWNLFSHTVRDQLDSLVVDEFTRRSLDPASLTEYPYAVCFANDFEIAIQVMHEASIDKVMKGLVGGDKLGWLMGTYIKDTFRKELSGVKPLFPEERDALLNLR